MSNILVTSLVLFNYFPRNTGSVQSFTAPQDGTYKLEVWGAQGGDDAEQIGGNGGYAYGTLKLASNNFLYITVGSKGITGPAVAGGFNGGGKSGGLGSSGSGGGATCITKTNRGVLSTFGSNRSEVYIVAGGGGGAGHTNQPTVGGTGGGLNGGNGYNSIGGTQTSGYVFGQGQDCGPSEDGGGGGSGWYGGYAAPGDGGAGGGSGYIGGVSNGSTTSGIHEGDGYAQITQLSF